MSQVLEVLLAPPAAPPSRPQPASASLDDVLKLVSNLAAGMADVQARLAHIEDAVEKRGSDRDVPAASFAGTMLAPPTSALEGGNPKLVVTLPPQPLPTPPVETGGAACAGEAGPPLGGGSGGGSGGCGSLLAVMSRVNAAIAELGQRVRAASNTDDFDAAAKLLVEMNGFTRAAEALQGFADQWAE